jgi:hypothetical protein
VGAVAILARVMLSDISIFRFAAQGLFQAYAY